MEIIKLIDGNDGMVWQTALNIDAVMWLLHI